MRSAILGMVVGLMLVGCNPGAGVGVGGMKKGEVITREAFLAAMGTDGVVGAQNWSAEMYVGEDPPMDGMLIDALADPFAVDADWMKPEKIADRSAMLKKLTDWWVAAEPGVKVADMPADQVASRFSIVVGARILMARLQSVEGDQALAMKTAVETMQFARKGFETAPGMVCADLMPSVVMAAEALAKIGEQGGEPPAVFHAGLDAMRFSIFERVAGSASDDFYLNQLSGVIEKMNMPDQPATVAGVVDPMGDTDEPVESLEKALEGKKAVDLKLSATFASDLLKRFEKAPADFEAYKAMRELADKDVTNAWGINIFEVRPENWGNDLKATENAAGVAYLTAVERKWLSTIESSYLMQVSLDAARLRLSNSMLARDLVNDEGKKLLDPLTGEAYSIDMKNEILRTTLKGVDSKFIFVNQLVQNGVPLSR